SGDAIVDHRIASRLDIADGRACKALAKRLDASRQAVGTDPVEFADPAAVVCITHRPPTSDHRAATVAPGLPWLIQAAASGEVRLMTCAPSDAVDIDDAHEWHASLVAFPATIAAATAARERGMTVVGAAP